MPGGTHSGKPLHKLKKPELYLMAVVLLVAFGYTWFRAFKDFDGNIVLITFGGIFLFVFIGVVKELLGRSQLS